MAAKTPGAEGALTLEGQLKSLATSPGNWEWRDLNDERFKLWCTQTLPTLSREQLKSLIGRARSELSHRDKRSPGQQRKLTPRQQMILPALHAVLAERAKSVKRADAAIAELFSVDERTVSSYRRGNKPKKK
jgi:hypothetical protein